MFKYQIGSRLDELSSTGSLSRFNVGLILQFKYLLALLMGGSSMVTLWVMQMYMFWIE